MSGGAEKTPQFEPEILEFGRQLARLESRTPVTLALVGVNAAVFVAMALAGAGVFDTDANVHVRWGSNLVPVTVDGEWWRLATSMFLHFGILHVAVNMWVLYANGRLTERLYGSARYLLLYLFAGLAGSMASAWWHAAANSAGASGAVFGVLGGMFAFMLAGRRRIPALVLREQGKSIAAFVAYNIVFGVVHPGIDNAAHAGGLVGGFLIGLALARPLEAESRERPQLLRVAAVATVAALLLVAAAGLVLRAKEDLPPAERYAAAALWFDYREPRILAAYNDMVGQAQAGNLADAAFAGRIGDEVLPFYARAKQRLSLNPADSGGDADRRRRVADYVDLRHRSMALLQRALVAGDNELARQAMEISRAADEAAAQFAKGAEGA